MKLKKSPNTPNYLQCLHIIKKGEMNNEYEIEYLFHFDNFLFLQFLFHENL